MSVRKQFDLQLYEENDKRARRALRKLFKGNKIYAVEDSAKRTDVDIVVMTKKGHICNIELEIKRVWKTKEFLGRPKVYLKNQWFFLKNQSFFLKDQK